MSRLDAVRVLAWTLPDVLPGPGFAVSGAVRGESPGAWRLCGGCDGDGEVRDRFGRGSVCGECGGARRYRVDPVTLERVSAADSHAAPQTRAVRCDRCGGGGLILGRYVGVPGMVRCRSCDGTGTLHVPLRRDRDDGDGQQLRVGGVRDTGDWDRLQGALAGVSVRERTVFVSVNVWGEPTDDSTRFQAEAAVLRRMGPAPIRVPGWAYEAYGQRGRRDEAKEAARKARVYAGGSRFQKRLRAAELVGRGFTVQEAARLAGCSVRTAQRALAA